MYNHIILKKSQIIEGIPMLTLSDDGYVRLTLPLLNSIPLHHYISGLDENPAPATLHAATATDITGYTEWISHTQPILSLGWDWQMGDTQSPLNLICISDIRSNIMLTQPSIQHSKQNDIGNHATQTHLRQLIQTLNWQDAVKNAIQKRYQ